VGMHGKYFNTNYLKIFVHQTTTKNKLIY